MADFNLSIPLILENEGGYTNDPQDSGGPTNFGITIGDLKEWRKNKSLTANDVKNMSLNEAKEIYKSKYWNSLILDKVSSQNVASVIFDQAVNRGVKTIAIEVQSVLNGITNSNLKIDGIFGVKTIEALNLISEKLFILSFIEDAQIKYARIVQNNHSQSVFLVGWLVRTHALLKFLL